MTVRPQSFSLALAASIALTACAPKTDSTGATGSAITAEAIRRHTSILADDSLEGRGTGQTGYLKAADYVAAQFKEYGLTPGGPGSSYLQPIRFREADLVAGSGTIAITGAHPATLTFGKEFVMSPGLRDSTVNLNAPVVFVGYGVSAPELNHDDYAGVDVKGKIVAVLFGGPPSFQPNPRAHFSGEEKSKVAAERGALAVVTLWSDDDEKTMAWTFLERITRRTQMTWLNADGSLPRDNPEIAGGLMLSPSASAKLFAGAKTTFRAAVEAARSGKPQSIPLTAGLSIRQTSALREVGAPNVIATLRGSDSTLAKEYVVFTAHLDHDGIGESIAGDSIYNGAVDNAAAVAALLEIAKAFASQKVRPKRSLVFIATAAEEKGLLGAAFFAVNPTVPLGSIVANLNMDGNHMVFPTRSVVALGAETSTLGEDAKAATDAAGLELETDLMPEQAFFIRSDQYPFIKRGVPALFFINGTRSSDSTINGDALLGTWLATVYHTPKDDLQQPMHYESGAKYADVVYRVGERVANAASRPTWKPGDFFGERFGKPAAR